MRRFWQPVPVYGSDLKELPVRIRMLGEDLVVFRDKSGHVGLLELHCSHRGTSLEFGLVEHTGIRCCYHGWLFGVDGSILDTPGEPPNSTYKERLCHGAYPVHEYLGLVFAYMGPPDQIPPFRRFDSLETPGIEVKLGTMDHAPCNWLQVTENGQDPIHTAFLHTRSSGGQFFNEEGRATMEFGEIGELDFMKTPIGQVYIITRRAGNDVWVRLGEVMQPNMQQAPGNPVFPQVYPTGKKRANFHPWFTKWILPVDDTNTISIIVYYTREGYGMSHVNPTLGAGRGNTGDRPYEERQRNPGDYEAEIGQGPIAIHARECLGSTDRGVILFRNSVREGIRAVQRGEIPKGLLCEEEEIIPTYCTDTIMLIPPASTPKADRKLLRETGQIVAEGYLQSPPANSYTTI
jgi:phenylpropionate dioxygenase-like ring-hydroxylating dioxygenase large terminal subunit